jgi:hypothetical protein
VGEEGVARGPGEPEVEERVVEAEPAGPGQHGPLEQRRRDGSRGGGGEGERGGAPRGRSAHRGREERRLDGRRRRPAEREGVAAGGGGVEEVGEHGDGWGAELQCLCCMRVRVQCFGFLFSVEDSVKCVIVSVSSVEGSKKTRTRNQRREKITVCPRIFCG